MPTLLSPQRRHCATANRPSARTVRGTSDEGHGRDGAKARGQRSKIGGGRAGRVEVAAGEVRIRGAEAGIRFRDGSAGRIGEGGDSQGEGRGVSSEGGRGKREARRNEA